MLAIRKLKKRSIVYSFYYWWGENLRENKMKKSKLIYLKPKKQLKNILLQIYDLSLTHTYIMEIKKIIALL